MGIPNVSKEQLTKELDTMKQSGLYRPIINELIENHEDNNIIASLRKEIADMKTVEQNIIEKFNSNIQNLERSINQSTQQMNKKETNLKALTIDLDNDILNLETTTTPLTYSIINWSICFILFTIIIFTLYYFCKLY